MIRRSLLAALPFAALAAGCSKPAPTADPAAVDRLVASFEAPARPAGAEPAADIEEKIEKADRLSGTLVKVEPDRVDPDVAAALIAR